ncbi:MAG: DUF1275 domain-containing protein, partial [Candidatus Eremiobacteraeota bacterium]|nr:DUF1275 domain-containing protein [Candidatus Eremiobacteraeota bacterium]
MTARLVGTLVVLTLVAGYVDAVAFFGMGVFTANMTGNTVLLAGALAERFVPKRPGEIALTLCVVSIGCFAGGAVAAAFALRDERARPPVRSRAILLVVALLLAFCAYAQHAGGLLARPELTVAVLSAVMGMQSIVAVRAGVPGISTTFVTGTIVRAVSDFEASGREPRLRPEGAVNAIVWACYLAGAL